MTGTLGSKETRDLLEKIYRLEFDYIPPNRMKILKELDCNLCFNHELMIQKIIFIVERETNGNRAILIICETIEIVNEIYEKLKNNLKNISLIKIIGENSEKNISSSKISSKTVIVSTNISGRGTDIKLDNEVLNNGGLHVLITFIPKNIRVEEQNYGRAGRKGEPGTWQLVINYQEAIIKFNLNDFRKLLENEYIKYIELVQNENNLNDPLLKELSKYFSIEFFKDMRENFERNNMKNAIELILQVNKEDLLFNSYCNILRQKNELRKEDNEIYLNSIEQEWSIFLYNLITENRSWDQIKCDFDYFKNKIFQEYEEIDKDENRKILKSPGFCNIFVNKGLSIECDKRILLTIANEIKDTILEIFDLKFIFPNNDKKYDKYIKKIDLSIKLGYKNSFIPYYLKAICLILSKSDDSNDIIENFKDSLSIIDKEIERNLFIYNILGNLKVNAGLPFYQMLMLINIKTLVIKNNLIQYQNLKDLGITINKKDISEIFISEEKENHQNKMIDCMKVCVDSIKNDGLQNIFFLEEESFLLKFRGFFVSLIKLVIQAFTNPPLILKDYIKTLCDFPFDDVLKKIYIKFFKEKPDDSDIKNINQKEIFPKEDDFLSLLNDEEFFTYLKNRKKIEIQKELDLLDIFQKNDKDNNVENKTNNIIEKKLMMINFMKKINKLCSLSQKFNFSEEIEYEEKVNNENNFYNDSDKNRMNKREEEIKKYLDGEKTIALLGNCFLRVVSNDLLSNNFEEIFQRLEENIEILTKMAKLKIIEGISKKFQIEIDNQKKNVQIKREKVNENSKILHEKMKLYYENFNKLNQREKKFRDELQCDYKDGNTIEILNNLLEEVKKEKVGLEKDKDENITANKKLKEQEKEINDMNNKINNKINEFNNLCKYINIKGQNNKLKIYLENSNINYSEYEGIFKEVEKLSNCIIEEEIKRISKKQIFDENNKRVINKILKFEEELGKIANENNYLLDNCFNNSLSEDINIKDYSYDFDDMNKIIKYFLKNSKYNNDSYYISDIYSKKVFDKTKNALENKKIVFGNFLNNNNIWTSFCLIPRQSPYTFLYKSYKGEIPSIELRNFVKEITGNYYIEKINKFQNKNSNELSEVDAIENTKIMIQQIQKNKNEFINNFESFKQFFNGNLKEKENLKKIKHPEEYIKSFYKESNHKINSSKISLGIFKYFFLEENKSDNLDIKSLNKIYEILMNNNDISEKEKEILKQEYNDINAIYEKNKLREEENRLKEENKSNKENELKYNFINENIINEENIDNPENDDIKPTKEKSSLKENNLENQEEGSIEENNKNLLNSRKNENNNLENNNSNHQKGKEFIINNQPTEESILKNPYKSKNYLLSINKASENSSIQNNSINQNSNKIEINQDYQLSKEELKSEINLYNKNEVIENAVNENEGINKKKGCLERLCDCFKH